MKNGYGRLKECTNRREPKHTHMVVNIKPMPLMINARKALKKWRECISAPDLK
jgi:hypothetical protein